MPLPQTGRPRNPAIDSTGVAADPGRSASSHIALSLLLVALGVLHRGLLFVEYRPQLDALIAGNPTWYTFQYLPIPVLRDQLREALLYLQQFPPLPTLVMGLALKAFSWPFGVAYALIALQAVLSIATALVLFQLLLRLYPQRPIIMLAIAIVFLVNADLIVLEYNSFGQTFYEDITMLLSIGFVYFVVELRRVGSLRYAVGGGTLVGLLALTRGTWCYFGPVAAVLTAVAARRRRGRCVAFFLLPLVLLHGAWIVKNDAVFGRLSLATSTWGGIIVYLGLGAHEGLEPLKRFVIEQHTQPEWYLRVLKEGIGPGPSLNDPDFPPQARAIDEAMAARFGDTGVFGNSLAFALMSDEMGRSFVDYSAHHPGRVALKTLQDYGVFWQPIRYYGSYFIDLFAAVPVIPNVFDLPEVARLYLDGALPEPHVVRSSLAHTAPTQPAQLYTIPALAPVIDEIKLVALHVLLPILLCIWIVGAIRHRGGSATVLDGDRGLALATALAVFGYLALTTSVGAAVENMRYRLAVEPVIWAITVLTVGELGRWLRGGWAARRSASAAGAGPRG
jgi:hypothetical protein